MQKDGIHILKDSIDAVCKVSNEAWQEMSVCWHEVNYGRKQLLTRAGDVEHYLYFVLDGVQRAYVNKDGKDSTLVFSYKGSFSGIVDSLMLQQPSIYHLETITKSRLLRMHYNDFNRLLNKYRCIETWGRVMLTIALSGTLQRNIELLSFTAEEKFRTLLQRSPHVLNLIPHKYLASYIGVDPATFSRLLSTVKL